MPRTQDNRWMILVGINVAAWCMLGFYRAGDAAPAPQPFANAVEQRAESNTLMRDLLAEVKAQNALLRSGTLQVVVVETKKKP